MESKKFWSLILGMPKGTDNLELTSKGRGEAGSSDSLSCHWGLESWQVEWVWFAQERFLHLWESGSKHWGTLRVGERTCGKTKGLSALEIRRDREMKGKTETEFICPTKSQRLQVIELNIVSLVSSHALDSLSLRKGKEMGKGRKERSERKREAEVQDF